MRVLIFHLLECTNCLNRFWWGERQLVIRELPPACDVCGKDRYSVLAHAPEAA